MSEKCEIEVKLLPKDKVEVVLFGKGAQVIKGSQELPKGETFVLAGNAPKFDRLAGGAAPN